MKKVTTKKTAPNKTVSGIPFNTASYQKLSKIEPKPYARSGGILEPQDDDQYDQEFIQELQNADLAQQEVGDEISDQGAVAIPNGGSSIGSDPGIPTDNVYIGGGTAHPAFTTSSGRPKRKRKTGRWDNVAVEKTYIPDPCPFVPYEEDDAVGAATPSDTEDFESVRESLTVLKSPERTIVFALVIDKEKDNVISAIRCSGGIPFGGYAHDQVRDAYLVQCVEFHQLGAVPFSLVLSMPNIGSWQVKVPIPDSVLEKHFTPIQKKALEAVRERCPAPRYEIQFMQMLGCH